MIFGHLPFFDEVEILPADSLQQVLYYVKHSCQSKYGNRVIKFFKLQNNSSSDLKVIASTSIYAMKMTSEKCVAGIERRALTRAFE